MGTPNKLCEACGSSECCATGVQRLSEAQQMVRTFHLKHGFAVDLLARMNKLVGAEYAEAKLNLVKVAVHRLHLIQEETGELALAMSRVHDSDDVPSVALLADALADLLYVVLGTAETYGVDIAPIFTEVQRSNMTKEPKQRRYDDSSNLHPKGKDYSPPKLEPILVAQGFCGRPR